MIILLIIPTSIIKKALNKYCMNLRNVEKVYKIKYKRSLICTRKTLCVLSRKVTSRSLTTTTTQNYSTNFISYLLSRISTFLRIPNQVTN